jgi:hypothetical protein
MGKTGLLPRGRVRRGQTIVVVALSALVLLGLVALAVDGGSTLVQRRNMQNAADAAALGAAQLLQSNMTTSCTNISGLLQCKPTYLLTNQDALSRVQQLTAANGAQTFTLEYHFSASSFGSGYRSSDLYGLTEPLPVGLDGVRVNTHIDNPTTFAQAINIPSIPVQAVSAARLYPTCVPTDLPGAVLPLTRYRPALETELTGTVGLRNDLCHPLKLWDWHPGGGDIQSPYFTAAMSFNETPFFPSPRVFTQFDNRSGTAAGLGNYHADSGDPPYGSCPIDCADMTGSLNPAGDIQDLTNWIFWRWGLAPSTGVLSSTNNSWPQNTGTWYQANRTNNGGQTAGCCSARQGDWTDIYADMNLFANGDEVQDAIADVAHYNPTTTLTGLNWGKGIDANMYLWGPALPDFIAGGGDDKSAQMWLENAPNPNDDPNCGIFPNPPCNPYTGWEDLTIAGAYGGYSVSTAFPTLPPAPQINRVRVTRAVRVRLYDNLNSETGVVSSYCPTLPDMGAAANYNTVWGYILNVPEPGPTDATLCSAPGTWTPGGGVYSRLIDPNAP